MKRINGKPYIEVVAVESTSGAIHCNEIKIAECISTGSVKRYIDKGYVRMMHNMDNHNAVWAKLADSKIIMYYNESERTKISGLDIDYSYTINGKPVTAYELIQFAQEKIDKDLFDTKLAARLLMNKGYRISNNPTPTKKYDIR